MNNSNQHHSNLSESLSENDLKWLVDDTVLIDMHKTKLGEDADHIVLALAVNDKKPAHDLATFIENSVYDFEDVEVSAATDTQGRYLIYVEMPRSNRAFNTINGVLKDATRLTGIEEWKFKTMNVKSPITFDEGTFDAHIVTDPVEYQQLHPKEEPQEETDPVKESIKSRFKFLLNY